MNQQNTFDFRNLLPTHKDWEIVSIQNITESLDFKRVPVEASLRKQRSGEYPYYGASGIIDYIDDYIFDEETLLVAEDGANLLTRATPIAFKAQGKYWVNNHAHVLKVTQKVNINFLHYVLNLIDLEPYVTGTAQPKLTAAKLANICIPLPPLPEQQRIAAILAKADRLRRLRRYTLDLGESYLQSVFLEMFGQQLKPDHPKIPLGDLVTITGGGTPSREVDSYFIGDIPWLTSKDMIGEYISDTQEHITEEAIKNSATKLVPKNSILVVVKSKILMRRLPLAITRVPLCHGQDIKSIQCPATIEPLFLLYVLKHNESRLLDQARGANTEGLTLPMLQEVPVPHVDFSLQQKFAKIAHQYERLRAQQREAVRQAEHLFQALLQRAFAGGVSL